MKLYIVNASHYHYWKDACTSGFVTKRHYFTNEENANKFIIDGEANPTEVNFEGKIVPIEADYKKPSFSLEVVETED